MSQRASQASISSEVREDLARHVRGSRDLGTGALATLIEVALASVDDGVPLDPTTTEGIRRRWIQSHSPALGVLLIALGDLPTGSLALEHRAEIEEFIRKWEHGPFSMRDALRAALSALDRRLPLPRSARETLEEMTGGWFTGATAVHALLAALDGRTSSASSAARRPASRQILRDMLALARDALGSPSEGFRSDVQDVATSLLGDEAETDGDRIHGEAGLARLTRVQEYARALSKPTSQLIRCALCGEAAPPEARKFVASRDDRGHPIQIVLHDDLAHCAFLQLSGALRAWAAENRFDDDQNPALDTVAQRLVRAHGRFTTLTRDREVPIERPPSPEVVRAYAAVALEPRPIETQTTSASTVGQLAAYSLSDAHRTMLSYYVYAHWRRPYGLGEFGEATGALLRSLGSGYPPPDSDLRALQRRGDKLAEFPELEAAVAALVGAVEAEATQRTKLQDALGQGEP